MNPDAFKVLFEEPIITPHGLPSPQVLFDELDHDGSGELDWSEFKEALRQLSIRLPVHKMRTLFERLDEDRQGSVSYHEVR